MADYLRHHNANTHWHYPSSRETDVLIGEARQAVGGFLNASPDEVAFGLNMTTLTFHLARGLVRGWQAGDEIVVTELDHQGNVGPWEAIARDAGLALVRIPFRVEDGTLDLDRLVRAIGPRTRLVAVGWASNALGTVTDPMSGWPVTRPGPTGLSPSSMRFTRRPTCCPMSRPLAATTSAARPTSSMVRTWGSSMAERR